MWREENWSTTKKPSNRGESQQQTQLIYDTGPILNLGDIVWKRTPSPLRHRCSLPPGLYRASFLCSKYYFFIICLKWDTKPSQDYRVTSTKFTRNSPKIVKSLSPRKLPITQTTARTQCSWSESSATANN